MNYKTLNLSTLPVGSRGIIKQVNADGMEKTRLNDLGFHPATEIKALFKSPSGNQTAYEIMGAVLALRKEDAGKITIQKHK